MLLELILGVIKSCTLQGNSSYTLITMLIQITEIDLISKTYKYDYFMTNYDYKKNKKKILFDILQQTKL